VGGNRRKLAGDGPKVASYGSGWGMHGIEEIFLVSVESNSSSLNTNYVE
jgi:hypothetical protein